MKIIIREKGQLIEIQLDKSIINIAKSAIRSLEPVRGNTLKVTVSDDSQSCLYLDAGQVIEPEGIADNDELRKHFVTMINNTGGTDDAHFMSIMEELDVIDGDLSGIIAEIVNSTTSLNRSLVPMTEFLNQIRNILDGAYNCYKEPLRVDETVSGLTYYGYAANVAALPNEPAWAVKRVKYSGGLTTTCWANGSRDFASAWTARTSLDYIPG